MTSWSSRRCSQASKMLSKPTTRTQSSTPSFYDQQAHQWCTCLTTLPKCKKIEGVPGEPRPVKFGRLRTLRVAGVVLDLILNGRDVAVGDHEAYFRPDTGHKLRRKEFYGRLDEVGGAVAQTGSPEDTGRQKRRHRTAVCRCGAGFKENFAATSKSTVRHRPGQRRNRFPPYFMNVCRLSEALTIVGCERNKLLRGYS